MKGPYSGHPVWGPVPSVWGPVQELGGHQMARAQRSAVRPALGARGPGPQS